MPGERATILSRAHRLPSCHIQSHVFLDSETLTSGLASDPTFPLQFHPGVVANILAEFHLPSSSHVDHPHFRQANLL